MRMVLPWQCRDRARPGQPQKPRNLTIVFGLLIEEWQLKSVTGKSAKKNEGKEVWVLRKVARPPVLSAVGGWWVWTLWQGRQRPMLYLPTYLPLPPSLTACDQVSFPVPTTFAKLTVRCQIRKTT